MVVNEGDVGRALSSLLVIMATECGAAIAIAVASQRRNANRSSV